VLASFDDLPQLVLPVRVRRRLVLSAAQPLPAAFPESARHQGSQKQLLAALETQKNQEYPRKLAQARLKAAFDQDQKIQALLKQLILAQEWDELHFANQAEMHPLQVHQQYVVSTPPRRPSQGNCQSAAIVILIAEVATHLTAAVALYILL
jgi:hypothetical protein